MCICIQWLVPNNICIYLCGGEFFENFSEILKYAIKIQSRQTIIIDNKKMAKSITVRFWWMPKLPAINWIYFGTQFKSKMCENPKNNGQFGNSKKSTHRFGPQFCILKSFIKIDAIGFGHDRETVHFTIHAGKKIWPKRQIQRSNRTDNTGIMFSKLKLYREEE